MGALSRPRPYVYGTVTDTVVPDEEGFYRGPLFRMYPGEMLTIEVFPDSDDPDGLRQISVMTFGPGRGLRARLARARFRVRHPLVALGRAEMQGVPVGVGEPVAGFFEPF